MTHIIHFYKSQASILSTREPYAIFIILLDRTPHFILREPSRSNPPANIRNSNFVVCSGILQLTDNLEDLGCLGSVPVVVSGLVVQGGFGCFDETEGFV